MLGWKVYYSIMSSEFHYLPPNFTIAISTRRLLRNCSDLRQFLKNRLDFLDGFHGQGVRPCNSCMMSDDMTQERDEG
jgi:hypothetical protein